MITRILLKRFKRFRELQMNLRRLSVFTGANGAGKSTVIQAILLARQVSQRPDNNRSIELNGPYGLDLGEGQDVLFREADQPTVEVELTTTTGDILHWDFGISEDRCLYLSVNDQPKATPAMLSGEGRQFIFLGADRLGPQDALQASSLDTSKLGVGARGEYVAHVLATLDRNEIREARRFPGSDIVTFLHQTERWVSNIVRPIEIRAEWFPSSSVTRLLFKTPGVISEWMRPANSGFGISYSLPVVVAGLLAESDGLLIVENPEAHLHPAGQSAIGEFLARVAGDGVQVIVETHSDHVLNGIRRTVSSMPAVLPPNDVIIHFFHFDDEQPTTPIELSATGKLTEWPSGFFDQLDVDLAALARTAKRREE